MRNFDHVFHLRGLYVKAIHYTIPHCDVLVKETIDLMHGPGKWHFQRSSHASKLKFYEVSESVDNVQNQNSTYFLDNV